MGRFIILVLALIALSIFVVSPDKMSQDLSEELSVEIARWRGGASGAVTLSFDDGYIETYNSVVPLLDAIGVNASFNIISSNVGGEYGILELAPWKLWIEGSISGHEIASHMTSHTHVDEISLDALAHELISSKMDIKRNTGKEIASFVYPGGAYDTLSRGVVEQHFISARTSDDGFNDDVPVDMHLLRSKTAAMFAVDTMDGWVDEIEEKRGWLIENYHLVAEENPSNYSFYISTENFERHLDYLDSKDLWIAPQGDVALYILEREASSVTLTSTKKGWIVLDLENGLNPIIFDEPLTLIIRSSNTLSEVNIIQGGQRLEGHISEDAIYFNAKPNNGRITITRSRMLTSVPALIRMFEKASERLGSIVKSLV